MANSSIYILNKNLEVVSVIDDYEELEWQRSDFGIGSFSLVMDRYQYNPNLLQKGFTVVASDPSAVPGDGIQHPYLIEQIELMFDSTGRESEVVILSGRSIGGILEDRLCLPDPGMDYHTMKGNAEMVLKHYVEDNCGPTAHDSARRLPNFEVAPNLNRGNTIYYKARYQTLADILQEVSHLSGFGWQVTLDPVRKKFVFDIIEGTDRRAGTANSVILDVNYDTVLSQHWVTTDFDRKTFAYVAPGEPEEEEDGTDSSCTCKEPVLRFHTEVMDNDASDFFMIDSEKFDFETGVLSQTFPHDAGYLELAVSGAQQNYVEDTQVDFTKGDLDNVTATSSGGIVLKTATYVQTYHQTEDFEDTGYIQGLEFSKRTNGTPAFVHEMMPNDKDGNPQKHPESYEGRGYLRTVDSGLHSPHLSFIVDFPADAYEKKLRFRIKKSADTASYYNRLVISASTNTVAGSSPQGSGVSYTINGSGSYSTSNPYTFSNFDNNGTDWLEVVANLEGLNTTQFPSPLRLYIQLNAEGTDSGTGQFLFDNFDYHYNRTITGFPASGVGSRVSPAFGPLQSGTSGARSRVEFDVLTPAGTEVVVEAALTDSSSTKPEGWQFQAIQRSGDPIPGVQGQNINGKYLWFRTTLRSNSPDKTPTVNRLAAFFDQTFHPSGTRVSSLDLSSIGTNRSSVIEWTADTPQGTGVIVETAIGGGAWSRVQNGQNIPGLVPNQPLQGVTLSIRTTLQTDNTEVTPKLQELSVFFNKNAYAEPTGFDRRELFVDAKLKEGTVARSLKGDTKLRATRTPDTFEATLNPDGAYRYRTHWDVGDTVTVSNSEWGIQKDSRIVGVKYTANQDGYDLKVELGNPLPTLKSNVKREIERTTAKA